MDSSTGTPYSDGLTDEDAHIPVLISYSHDSNEHKEWVRSLANRLREWGIDVALDQYGSPPEGWAQWTLKQIRASKFVLVVCTGVYKNRFEGSAPAGEGRGAKWEGAITTTELYEAEGRSTKFLPVVRSPDDVPNIPTALRGVTYYDLSTEDGLDDLYRVLTEQPAIVKPQLGRLRPMPPVPLPPPLFTGTVEAGPATALGSRLAINLQQLHPSDHVVTTVIWADVDGDGHEEMLTLSYRRREDSLEPAVRLSAFAMNRLESTLQEFFSDVLPLGYGAVLSTADITRDGRTQLIAQGSMGSGGFLTYRVYDFRNREVSILLDRNGIFQGRLDLRPGSLLERSSDKTLRYEWDGVSFIGYQVVAPEVMPPDSVRVRYRVTSGKVVGPSEAHLHEGQLLELVRVDQTDDSTRVFVGTERLASVADKWGVYRALATGESTITIVPRGYDWEDKLDIKVTISGPED